MSEISLKYIRKHLSRICCVCLRLSKTENHLSDEIKVIQNCKPNCLTIKSMIESVTTSSMSDDDEAPSNVCSICLNYLKIAFDFKETFAKTQLILSECVKNDLYSNEKNTRKKNETVKEENNEFSPDRMENIELLSKHKTPSVELICLDNHFPLVTPKAELHEDLFNDNPAVAKEQIVGEIIRNEEMHADENSINNHSGNPENEIKNEFGEIPQDENELKTVFECEICTKRFRNKRGLKIHVQNAHDSKFVCEDCGMRFSTSSNLRYHLQKHSGKKFKCELCDKKYITVSHLKAHQKIHKNERVFLCSECGKNFNYPEALRYHMRLHTGEKNYTCNVCGLKYRMSNTLKRHMRTHTKERPFPCTFCPKRFSSMGEKRCHEMIHTGERPYKCEYCDKTCNKSWNLTTHLLSHSGQFECTFCDKTFIEQKYLGIHLRKVHSTNVEEIVS